jgi:hypothetical protein
VSVSFVRSVITKCVNCEEGMVPFPLVNVLFYLPQFVILQTAHASEELAVRNRRPQEV